ncbi:MAG: CpaF family protein [Lachnospiraceae bacterium]|nr:CpaF family protein [Lachnospiraceae bacterium]
MMDRYDFYRECKEKVLEKARDREIFREEALRKLILRVVREESRAEEIGPDLRLQAWAGRRIFNSLCRMDVLEPLIKDENITDIMVNGHKYIFYVKDGCMLEYRDRFDSAQRLEDLIQQIVGSVNRSVNEASPIVDARLEADGSRVNVVLPPAAKNGPILSLRKFRKDPITMEELVRGGTATEEMAEYLKQAVRDRANIFVCGGTSSGKTTLLNILSSYIDPRERVITIEDSAELQLRGLKNLVTLETRNANASGAGAITMRDLIKTSLRMNPDRIIVGEIRGAEALDMLSGLNTGHSGMSTGHANSCRDMLRRIETMVWMGAQIPLEAIRQQIASALDLMVFVEKGRDGKRRILEIVRVGEAEGGAVRLWPVVERKEGKVIWNPEERITGSTG